MEWQTVKETESRGRNRWEDDLSLYNYKKKKGYTRMRLVGKPIAALRHWVSLIKKDETKVSVPITCPKFEPVEGVFLDKKKCKTCKIQMDPSTPEKVLGKIRSNRTYYSNAIIRPLQKKGKKPIKRVRFPSSVASDILELADLALEVIKEKLGKTKAKKIEKLLDPAHPKFGWDFLIKFNKKAKTPAQAYSVQFVGITPLTKKELKYKFKKLDGSEIVPTSKADSNGILKRSGILKRLERVKEKESDDDLSELNVKELLKFAKKEEITLSKKEKKLKKKKLRKLIEEKMEEEDNDNDNDNDNDDNNDNDNDNDNDNNDDDNDNDNDNDNDDNDNDDNDNDDNDNDNDDNDNDNDNDDNNDNDNDNDDDDWWVEEKSKKKKKKKKKKK